jgi:FkbM family methyltransferase
MRRLTPHLARLAQPLRLSRKLARLLTQPEYRSGLRHGVAATIEHESVPFVHDFASVIDVGAHRGQFALFASVRFPSAHLYCVEPQDEARACIEAVIPLRRLTTIAYAVGVREEVASLHVTSRSDSSSLRTPTALAGQAFAGAKTVSTHAVKVRRLDDVLSGEAAPTPPILLKIDVQGAEYEALAGAPLLLATVHTVLVEVSFREFYAGQKLAADVVRLLGEQGFSWHGVYSISQDRLKRCLQADLLFERDLAQGA